MKRDTQFKRCPGSLVFMQPKPDMIPCVACGADTEIWSDEAEGKCPSCGATVVRYASQSCVDWCKHARECLGEDKYFFPVSDVRNATMSPVCSLVRSLASWILAMIMTASASLSTELS